MCPGLLLPVSHRVIPDEPAGDVGEYDGVHGMPQFRQRHPHPLKRFLHVQMTILQHESLAPIAFHVGLVGRLFASLNKSRTPTGDR